jgi:long-chain acyl-CoA synthetase
MGRGVAPNNTAAGTNRDNGVVSEAAEMEPDMSNLALNLVGTARRIPDRTAAISDDATMTYAELDAAASRLATFLDREGIGAGDRVGVMLPNIAAAPIAYYGIWRLGGVAVPMNPLMQAREVVPPPFEEA